MRPLIRVAIASSLLAGACTGAAAQELSCLRDAARHAQLMEQDAAQLQELQDKHGVRVVTERTAAIFERLIEAQHVANPASYAIDWRLAGYGAVTLNAHAMHSGQVVVTQGLDSPDLSEEAVAASLAHEMAHVMLRHGLEQACFALQVVQPGSSMRDARTNAMQKIWSSGNRPRHEVRSLSHIHELEADAKAIEVLRIARYPTHSMSNLLTLLAERQRADRHWVSDSHPDHALRIVKAKELEAGTAAPSRPARVSRTAGKR